MKDEEKSHIQAQVKLLEDQRERHLKIVKQCFQDIEVRKSNAAICELGIADTLDSIKNMKKSHIVPLVPYYRDLQEALKIYKNEIQNLNREIAGLRSSAKFNQCEADKAQTTIDSMVKAVANSGKVLAFRSRP